MQIAQVLANYTLGGADLLRRAMGKKKPEEMAKQRVIFTEGALEREISKELSTQIFDLMEKFAGYGFNKSHSAAYALVSYQTAWLKAHYPAAFMASVISADMDNTDKVEMLVQETRRMGIKVNAPALMSSEYQFTVVDDKTLSYGLGAIKGVGEGAIEAIIEARKHNEFKELFGFCQALDLKRVNRRVLEALIKSGTLDCFGVTRATLKASLENALQTSAQNQESQSHGQSSLLSLFDEGAEEEPPYVVTPEWHTKQLLEAEKETLGYYWSGHPTSLYLEEFGTHVTPIGRLELGMKKARVCGLVKGVRRIQTKRGKQLMIIKLEDASAGMDVVVFSEVMDQFEEPVSTNDLLVVSGEISKDDFTGGIRLSADELFSIADARHRFSKHLKIKLTPEDEAHFTTVKQLLEAHPGDIAVQILYCRDDIVRLLPLSQAFRVSGEDILLDKLAQIIEPNHVEVCY